MTFYGFRFKVLLLTFILLFTFLFNLLSFSYAQTCQGDDCLTEEDFINNPRSAFRNNANEAWNLIRQNPQGIYGGPNGNAIITQSAQDDPNNFLEIVSNNRDLLSIPQVLEEVAKLANRNVEVLNSNPQFRRDFLARFGVQDQGARIDRFQHGRRATTITTQSPRGQVEISLSMLNGGRINSDGSVTLRNEIEIHSGSVSITNSNLDFRRGGIIRVPNYEGFISSSSRLGVIHNLQSNSFQLSGRNMQLSDSRGVSRVSGAYTLLPNNQVILGGAGTRHSTIEYLNGEGGVLEKIGVSQSTYILNDRGCPTNSPISCIYRSGGNVVIEPITGNNRIEYELFTRQYSQFEVGLIRDRSNVRIRVPSDVSNRPTVLTLNQNGMRTQGRSILGENSNFNINYKMLGRDPNTGGLIEVTVSDYEVDRGRFYSIHTGVERPDFEPSRRCNIDEICRIGGENFIRNRFEVFCRSSDSNYCVNELGIRVDREGQNFVAGNPPQLVARTSQRRSSINLEELERLNNQGFQPAQSAGFRTQTRGSTARLRNTDGSLLVTSGALVFSDMAPYRCAEHSRRAGKQLYDKDYNGANAWDFSGRNVLAGTFTDPGARRSNHISPQEANSFQSQTISAINSGQMRPGDVVTVWNPRSNYRHHDVTHTLLFRGVNSQGQPVFDHQWGSRFEQITLNDVMARNLRPREIVTDRRRA